MVRVDPQVSATLLSLINQVPRAESLPQQSGLPCCFLMHTCPVLYCKSKLACDWLALTTCIAVLYPAVSHAKNGLVTKFNYLG